MIEEYKICPMCQTSFARDPSKALSKWVRQRYCKLKCARAAQANVGHSFKLEVKEKKRHRRVYAQQFTFQGRVDLVELGKKRRREELMAINEYIAKVGVTRCPTHEEMEAIWLKQPVFETPEDAVRYLENIGYTVERHGAHVYVNDRVYLVSRFMEAVRGIVRDRAITEFREEQAGV